jgi:integrase
MGYRVGPRIVKIRLRGTEFDGAEARAEAASAATYLATVSARRDRDVIAAFFEHLLDWNLETADDAKIPAPKADDADAVAAVLAAVDSSLMLSFADGWMQGSSRIVRDIPFVQPPVDQPATNGAVAMEAL